MPPLAQITRRYLAVTVAGVAVAALVAACSGGSSGGGGPTTTSSSAATGGQSTNGGNGTARGPAASGKIAAVAATSIEVQNSTVGQLTVDYSSTTKITQTITGSLADVKVGVCIVALDASATGASTSAAATTGSPTTIALSPEVNGSCSRTSGFGGTRPGGGNFTGTNRPSGFPTGGPSGLRSGAAFPGGANFANAVTSGKVTAVSGDTITVDAVSFSRGTASAAPSASPSATTTVKTVVVGTSTKITKEATVTTQALKVGLCAAAQGSSDSSGAVNATSIALTSPDSSGSCEVGFGRFTQGGGS